MARILVIDDREDIRDLVKLMLTQSGHEVVLAVDGDDGLQRFQAQPIDLVICDVFMPRKEGLETVKELRRMAADLPIITMSGNPSGTDADPDFRGPDFLRMTAMVGATATIAKPFKRDQLLALVASCLAGESARSAS